MLTYAAFTAFIKQLNIVLIADRTFKSCEDSDIQSDELEMISDEYFNDIFSALTHIGNSVAHYQSPKELIDNASKHINDLVITIYGGRASRNRMSLVPAICESYNIKFAGADVYSRTVCQDKLLSKEFARRYHIPFPAGVLVESSIPESLIKELNFPLVIKPNFEGSSIGISELSKVESYKKAEIIIRDLLSKFNQPVIVEEFIPGREICICLVGNRNKIELFEAMEIVFEEDETFLYNRLYTAQEKHLSEKSISHRSITEQFSPDQIKAITKLYVALGKMDFMRIDGRFDNGVFTMIELTPDGYLGNDSSFADAARLNKMSYEDLLTRIIHTALASYHIPYSSYT